MYIYIYIIFYYKYLNNHLYLLIKIKKNYVLKNTQFYLKKQS